jgi:hypothetical protein
LSTHLIDSNGLSALLKDDLEGFSRAREQSIAQKIASLTAS